MGDDAYRTQYTPPEPTVKILKRPSPNSNGAGDGPLINGDGKPTRQPIKTLQQVKCLSVYFDFYWVFLLYCFHYMCS